MALDLTLETGVQTPVMHIPSFDAQGIAGAAL
jgi:hypothetical protein